MCRLSGRRATPSCRFHYIPATPSSSSAAGAVPAAFVGAQPLPAPLPPVYSDIFPEGSVASETCAETGELSPDGVTRLVRRQMPRQAP